jgi:FdhE protein
VDVPERFSRRAERARELGKRPGAAADLLSFAAALFAAQARVATALAGAHVDRPLSGRLPGDVDRLLPLLPPFLRLVAGAAPEEMAAEASRRSGEESGAARERLLRWWERTGEDEDPLSRAFLRPYLELLSSEAVPLARPRRDGLCPACSGAPALSVRRADPESDAGRRFLVCGDCSGEWPFGRIRCPSCSEEDPAKLPTFQTETHPGVRIEACEACRRYLKSIDLTRDARPVPEVDDLLSVVLDLWAEEQGFARIEPGIAGL